MNIIPPNKTSKKTLNKKKKQKKKLQLKIKIKYISSNKNFNNNLIIITIIKRGTFCEGKLSVREYGYLFSAKSRRHN